MVDERRIDNLEDLGIPSIDPSTWIDPSTIFPGEIVHSYFRDAVDAYKAATAFHPQLDRCIQWYVRVKRLDAVVEMPDGSRHDAMARFWGIDVEKYSSRDKKMQGISSRFRKEFEIMTAWTKVFGPLATPDQVNNLEGKKAIFEHYDSVRIGGAKNAARNVLYAKEILDPDYVFDGEVQVFEGKVYEDEDT